MQWKRTRTTPRRSICRHAGCAALALSLALLAGCAASGGKVAAEKPADTPTAVQGPVVKRLEDGRKGFVISENASHKEQLIADFKRALDLLVAQDYPGAVILLQGIIEKEPGVTPPYIDIAIAYRHLGKAAEAETALKKALELFPGHPLASNEYGLLLRAAGHFDEARRVYEQALEDFPEYLPLHRNLGILCDIYLGDLECALEQYEIYAREKPGDEQVKRWIADLRLRSAPNEQP